MSGLRLEGVAKSYDGLRALQPLDLDAADGELLVVLGPSGCGKSTLLRVIAGLGLGPWDVLHQGLSRQTGLPIGWVVIAGGTSCTIGPTLERQGATSWMSNARRHWEVAMFHCRITRVSRS